MNLVNRILIEKSYEYAWKSLCVADGLGNMLAVLDNAF